MGSVKIDKYSNERRLNAMFPVDTEAGILALLSNIHHVRELRFLSGDYDASILLLDFAASIEGAELTQKQRQALYLVFEQDLKQVDAGKIMGISQQAVNDHIAAAVKKIVNYNRKLEGAIKTDDSK